MHCRLWGDNTRSVDAVLCHRFKKTFAITWSDSKPQQPPDNAFTKCRAGTFRNESNNNLCDPCAIGFRQAEDNTIKTACEACKFLGEVYANETGQSECHKCPKNTQKKTPEPHESGEADSILICECQTGALRVFPPVPMREC